MILRAVELGARDLDALEAFYGATLGLDTRRQRNRLTLTVGPTQLGFVRRADAGIHHFAFNVPAARFDEASRWIARRTPLCPDPDGRTLFRFDNWDATALYFLDPAGNIAEFIGRRALADPPEAPFDSAQILSVSEIGLVTNDVPALARRLRRRLGVDVFRGSESDGFTALGDDHGLLILARAGRDWYPGTGGAAQIQPVRVTLETASGKGFQLAGTSCRIRG